MQRTRRDYLAFVGFGTAAIVAGCTDDDDGTEDDGVTPVEAADTDGVDDAGETGEDDQSDELREMGLTWGDTIEHPDGFRITVFEPESVDNFETDTWDGPETVQPDNERFVFVEVTIENTSNSTIETPNSLDFELIVGNRQYERAPLIGESPLEYDEYPSLETLAPGSIAAGMLIYDVPAGDVELFYSALTEDFEDVEAIWA